MNRTETIARALAEQLREMGPEINARGDLRGIVFDIKLVPGTTFVRTIIVRPEFEWIAPASELPVNGKRTAAVPAAVIPAVTS